jgi:ATP-binding cassette subfamily B protein
MVGYFQNKYALSKEGAKDLVNAIGWTTLLHLSFMIPIVLGFKFLESCMPLLKGETVAFNGAFRTYGVSFVLAFVVMFFIAYKQYGSTYTQIYKESAKRRISLAETLKKLPLAFFNKKDIADLSATIMEDATQIEHLFSHSVPQIYSSIFSVVLMGIGMFIYNWKMSLAVFWVMPVAAFVFYISRRYQAKVHQTLYSLKREVSDEIQETLDLAQEIKSYNREAHYKEKIDTLLDMEEKEMIRGELAIGAIVNLSHVLLKLGLPSVILCGAYLVSQNDLSIFDYMVFLIVASRIYNPVNEVMNHFAALMYLNVRIDRMKEMDNMPYQEGMTEFEPNSYDIEFQNIDFSYEGNDNIINDVSFTAKQGEVTALVGPSGGGKSTLAKLAARFWDVDKGKVTLGGIDIATIDPETLLKYYSIVFQDVTLFNTSVMENIRLGRKTATDEEVIEAAKMARCHEFIEKLPDAYETVIGENGEKLSGGERQRISIARAILKDAPIILLDEATASLDAENESKVQGALSALIKDKTVLIIAHRMRTVLGADKIVVIKDGQVVENDHPSKLAKNDGVFASMLRVQYGKN